jgi:ketosteroid isomerase-like protein
MSDNAAIIRGVYDAFLRGDITAVVAAMDAQIEWNEAEHVTYWPGAPFIGPHAVLTGVFARLPHDFDHFRVEIGRLVAAGDTVIVEARYRAVAKATGKPLDAQVAHVWDLRDGKIVRFQQYVDTWQFAQVTGVAPRQRTLA